MACKIVYKSKNHQKLIAKQRTPFLAHGVGFFLLRYHEGENLSNESKHLFYKESLCQKLRKNGKPEQINVYVQGEITLPDSKTTVSLRIYAALI